MRRFLSLSGACFALLFSFPQSALADFVQLQAAAATTKIQHVIIIMQENRSFDHYFGTYPGADGIPAGICLPYDPTNPAVCLAPFHDFRDANSGANHGAADALQDIDGGKMDGFMFGRTAPSCDPSPQCLGSSIMGYHTSAEIPNYWNYAKAFVLQDHLYEPVASFSLPSHLYMVSEWSASCSQRHVVASCVSADGTVLGDGVSFPWTDLTYLLDKAGVSWKYYLAQGTEPDCETGEMTCAPVEQSPTLSGFWNPLPTFQTVKDAQSANPNYLSQHIVQLDQFLLDIKNGTLPSVSWVVPSDEKSEHPPNSVQAGMVYVSSLINAIMETGEKDWTGTKYWNNTVIILSWDDWGGFYDHEPPPVIDKLPDGKTRLGYGIRVPGIIISAYARPGFIDHQVMSFDAYNKFIEDVFLNSQRLDPATDGRPDPRPDVREAIKSIRLPSGQLVPVGDLLKDFNFFQTPRPPLLQPTTIPLAVAATITLPATTLVTWNAVTTAPVIGYNVKRSLSQDTGYIKLPGCNGVGFTQTSCNDNIPPPGQTYFYVVSSIAPNGTESPNSAIVRVPQ